MTEQSRPAKPGGLPAAPRIRLARVDEAALVQTLSAAAYVPAYRPVIDAVPGPASEDYAPRIAAKQVWLLQAAEDVVGLIVLEAHPDHLHIYSVAVRPDRQRRGFGRRLLAVAEDHARARGLAELRLFTNPKMTANVRLYRACGFIEVSTRPHPSRPGEELLDMSKQV